ncbi:MAG: hypothetical protein JWM57_4000 [Phycisphaerales bacterium]|nr:hypothetical protein [Phycisphaerales bacterium]
MRLLFDTNIVLDLLLDRAPFAEEAEQLWAAVDDGLIRGAIATFSIPTIHYIVARHHSPARASDAVWACITSFDLCATYRENIIAAAKMNGPDFEDSLQITTAVTDFLDGIITRDPKGFRTAPLPIYTPTDALRKIGRHKS